MYIIMKTNEPLKTKILHNGQKAHYFSADNLSEAEACLNEIENTENSDYWSKYDAMPDLPRCKEFNEYLKQIILEPNKLSPLEMQALCFEAQKWFPYTAKEGFACNFESVYFYVHRPEKCYDLKNIWEELVNIIDRYTQTKNNIKPWVFPDDDFNPVINFGLKFHFINMQNIYNTSLCGAFNMKFYKLIYYFDFLGIEIKDSRLKEFWDFYKRTLNVYSITAVNEAGKNVFYILPKPDEIFMKNEIMHYTYGSNCYCDGTNVEKWLYAADGKNLKLSDFDKIKNADYRSIFIKKAGIEKFIRRGEIVDTWENYPGDEWRAKSEYKLIDMRKVFFIYIRTSRSGRVLESKNYDYAPFLYMKNQTTGEYHLEGVSPDCKNLDDALNMRYKNLNLPDYEVKDIK